MVGSLRRGDLVVPLVVATVATAEVLAFDGEGRWAALGLELVACGLLVFRRRSALLIATAAGVVAMGPWYVGPALNDLAAPILVFVTVAYTLGRWIADLRGLTGMAVILGATVVAYVFVDEREHDVTDIVFVTALFLPPYVFGRISRKLAIQSEQLKEQQELVRQAAVRDERDRIAREVHDVIAHSISAMVVQAAAAQELMNSDPRRAQQALDRVTDTGRKAIAETGRLLHVIRDADNELGLAPTPGLRDVDELVTEFREHGLVVELLVEAELDTLPAAVDVSAYRIAREALTNALRYSPDRRVRLEVLGTSSGLTLRARNANDGRTGAGSGLGLAGLAERVDLLGGSLSHGPTGAGDYELVARLPLVTRELV